MFDLTLYGVISQIEADRIVLPAMQRPFVWQQVRITRLVDSLLRGFPLGTVLLWKTKTMQRYRRFLRDVDIDISQVFNFETSQDQDKYLVLDGQQRLTSLLIALRGTYNSKRLFLDVLSGDSTDKDPGNEYYDSRFLTETEAKELNEGKGENLRYFVPVEKLTQIDPVDAATKAFNRAQELGLSSDQTKRMTHTYLRCATIMGNRKALQVHLIDEDESNATPVGEILEIFVRVNSGGLVLQRSDLLMSLLDLKWNDIQPDLQRAVREINTGKPFNFTRDDIVKSLLLAVGSETRFDRLVSDRNRVEKLAAKMPDNLPSVKQAWTSLTYILTDDCKIYSERFFRGGHNSLLPFVHHLLLNPHPIPGEKKRLVAGIYIAIMSGIFAGAEARMGGFSRNEIQSGQPFPLKKLAGSVKYHYGIANLEGLLMRHLDLALNIAHNGITIDGNPEDLQRDHIFPKSTLEKKYPPEKVNHYANFHFLRGKDNINKSNISPDQWFKSPGRGVPSYSDRDLEERLLTWELLKPDSFERMLQERSTKIKDRAAQIFGMSVTEFDSLFS